MKKLMLLLFLPCIQLSAQNLTGIWRGTFYTTRQESMFGSNNKYEVQIDNAGRVCKGVTYSYQNTTFFGKASLIGMWTPGSKNLIFKEDKLLEYKMEGDNDGVYMFTCYLEYRKDGNKEILSGDYTSAHFKTGAEGTSGKIYLEKVITSDFKKEDFIIKKENREYNKPLPQKKVQPSAGKRIDSLNQRTPVKPKLNTITRTPVKPKPNTITRTPQPQKDNSIARKTAPPAKPGVATPAKPKVEPRGTQPRNDVAIQPRATEEKRQPLKPAELPGIFKERRNELVQTILTPGPEISIELYDNGEIDGDTISVFQNGRLIASKRGLSTSPISLRLKIDENNPEQEITMVAENLGTIPPNTALMIVKSGGNRYDLRISSSESKNAVVKFRYHKE